MENIKWLWGVMDKRYHKWHILGLIISAVTSLMLLINPYLTMRLMDDVIVAQNPEPLVGLLLTMLIVKVVREGLRYLMVVLLARANAFTTRFAAMFSCAFAFMSLILSRMSTNIPSRFWRTP